MVRFIKILTIFILLLSSYKVEAKDIIANGILDFSELKIKDTNSWNFELDGIWEFYYNKLLTSEDFNNKNNPEVDYIKVPTIWKNSKNHDKLKPLGFATYRLQIYNLPKNKILSLSVNRILTSYRLYINGELLNENGNVGDTKDNSNPSFARRVISFNSDSGYVELIIQVSNFYDLRGGGIFRKIKFGSYNKISNITTWEFVLDIFLTGCIFFAAFYHLIFFLFRKKDKILFVFFLFFLFYGVRIILTGSNVFLYLFANSNWEILFKIEILTVIVSAPVIILLFKILFPKDSSNIIIKSFSVIAILFSMALIILPPPYFIMVLIYFYPFVGLLFIIMHYWIIKTLINKRKDSVIIGISMFCFFLTSLNDILFSMSFIKTAQLMPLSLLFLAFVQASIIAKRFSSSFYEVEHLTEKILISQNQLKNVNLQLEEKVKERTRELEKQIIEREKMEEQLLKNQKLEAIGLLAGGIAHDFNNLLAIISGNTSMIKLIQDDVNPEISQCLDDIETSCRNATFLTGQLLTFSKGGEPVKQLTDIPNLVRENVDLILRGSNLKPEYYIGNDIFQCNIDRGQISQVITNLIINAKQAMNNSGVIEIHIDNHYEESDLIKNFVKIAIKDHGPGIPKDHLDKIFDPFFSTKKKGKGLGLTTSYSIIKRHNGYISVDSKENFGSIFTILLPADSKRVENSIGESKKIINISLKGKVLVVDDETQILSFLSNMLSKLGLESITTTDGHEAISLFKSNKFLFCILDLTNPGSLSGKEVLDNILAIEKNAICIASSGYSNDAIMSHPEKYGFFGVLKKPYGFDDLKKIICKIQERLI